MSVHILRPWADGQIVKPPFRGNALKLSTVARNMGCVGAILFQDGSPAATIIGMGGPAGARLALPGGSNNPSVITSEEGLAFKTVAASQQRAVLTSAPLFLPGDISQCSIVARLKVGSNPAGNAWAVYLGTSGNTRQVTLGAGSNGKFAVSMLTGNGEAVVASSNTPSGFTTVGVSALSNINLFENGVLTANSSGWGGSTSISAGTTATIQLGIRPGGYSPNYFDGQNAWTFFFFQPLSSAQHWFVAKNPWALLSPVGISVASNTPVATGSTYDESISLGASLSLSSSPALSAVASATFSASLALSAVPVTNLEAAISLGTVVGLTKATNAVLNSAMSLALQAGLSPLAQSDISAAVSFGFSVSAAIAGVLTIDEAVALSVAAGFGASGLIDVQAPASFAVAVSAAMDGVTGSGGTTYDEAITLAVSALVSSAVQKQVDEAVSFGASVSTSLASQLNANAAVAFALALSQTVSAAVTIDKAISLSVSVDESSSGLLTVEGAITLPVEVAATHSVAGVLGAQVTFAAQFNQAASSILTYEEAVTLATRLTAQFYSSSGALPPRIIELKGQTESGVTLAGTVRLTIDLKGQIN